MFYNPSLTSGSAGTVKNFVRAAIGDYRIDNLNKFSSVFQKSKLQNYIEQSEPSITGSDIKIYLQKRQEVLLNQVRDYTFEFDVPIKKGDINQAVSSYPAVSVLDKNYVSRSVFFEEVPSIDSGIAGFNIISDGINYTSPPTVTIAGDGTGATAIARVAGGRIVSVDITNKGSNYTRASIILNGEVGSGAQIQPILENRIGKLRTYYVKSNGEKEFVNNEAGTIDYDAGKIVIKSLNPLGLVTNQYYDTNVFTISVPVDSQIISTVQNRIIDIDEDDPLAIQVETFSEQ